MNLGLPYPPVSRQLGCVFAVVIAPLALAIALAFIMIVHDGQFLIVAERLTVGWWKYITRTFPLISFNPMLVINGIGAAIAGGTAFHWVMSSLSRTSGSSWRIKWTVLYLAMFSLLFGVCISASALGLHLKLALVNPQFDDLPINAERSDQTLAMILLRQDLGLPAPSKEGVPIGWPGLAERKVTLFDGWQGCILESSSKDVPEIWTYLGDANFNSRMALPLLYAPRAYSSRGRIVAFSDGEVKVCSEREFEEALSLWHAARAQTTPPKKFPN